MRRRIFTKQDSEHRRAIDDSPRSVHIMIEPATTGSEYLAMGVTQVDPESRIPMHVHADAEEVLFIYEGRGRVRIGNEEVEIGPQTAIFVPKGMAHGFVNTSDGSVLLTWTFSPPGEQEKFRNEEVWKHVARCPPSS